MKILLYRETKIFHSFILLSILFMPKANWSQRIIFLQQSREIKVIIVNPAFREFFNDSDSGCDVGYDGKERIRPEKAENEDQSELCSYERFKNPSSLLQTGNQ
ncbi:MAG: hypothetical protein L0G39_04410 [Chryseobacterium sp.]|nr:hypothetical protein [Chryseobacterium sp.]